MIIVISLKYAWAGQQEYAEEPAQSPYDRNILAEKVQYEKRDITGKQLGVRTDSW